MVDRIRLDDHRLNIICAALRESSHRHDALSEKYRQAVNFREANNHTEFAKACRMIADEFDKARGKSSTGLVIPHDLH